MEAKWDKRCATDLLTDRKQSDTSNKPSIRYLTRGKPNQIKSQLEQKHSAAVKVVSGSKPKQKPGFARKPSMDLQQEQVQKATPASANTLEDDTHDTKKRVPLHHTHGKLIFMLKGY